jgi:Ca2+-binding RTX toxin-like protein
MFRKTKACSASRFVFLVNFSVILFALTLAFAVKPADAMAGNLSTRSGAEISAVERSEEGADAVDPSPNGDPTGSDVISFTVTIQSSALYLPAVSAGIAPADGSTLEQEPSAETAVYALCGGRRATIIGTHSADTLIGTAGDDVIVGGDGDDRIYGLGGDDSICGQKGSDWISGGEGIDTLRGGQGRDELRGGAGNDHLYGERDNDTIRGDRGDDTIYGGDGADWIDGDVCFNSWGLLQPEGSVTITTRICYIGSDRIDGGPGNDWIGGNFGHDALIGGADRDTLRGGAGRDLCVEGETYIGCEKR